VLAHGPTVAAKPAETLERALVATAAALGAILVAACGAVLAMRRLGGGFEPVGGAMSLAVAVVGGLLVLGCDAMTRGAGLASAWRHAARTGYLLALAALAVPVRAKSGIDMAFFVVGVGVAAAIATAPFIRTSPRRPLVAGFGGRHSHLMPWRRQAPSSLPGTTTALADAVCPGHLVQRFERYELDGVDSLRGVLTLTVPEGSRTAHGHVGFCPSFRQVPQVEASTPYDGVEAVVTAAEIVPWGVRIECRLDEPADEPIEIPVEIVARAPV